MKKITIRTKSVKLTKDERETIIDLLYGGKCWKIMQWIDNGNTSHDPEIIEMSDEVDRIAKKFRK